MGSLLTAILFVSVAFAGKGPCEKEILIKYTRGGMGTFSVPLKVVRQSQNLLYVDSLDDPVGDDGSSTKIDFYPAKTPSPEDERYQDELNEMFIKAFNEALLLYAPRTNFDIIKDIFYSRLIAVTPDSVKEIAERHGKLAGAVHKQEKTLKLRLFPIVKRMMTGKK